jgi:hypothetical protein
VTETNLENTERLVETWAEGGILEEELMTDIMNGTEPDSTDKELETHKDSPVISNQPLDMDTFN